MAVCTVGGLGWEAGCGKQTRRLSDVRGGGKARRDATRTPAKDVRLRRDRDPVGWRQATPALPREAVRGRGPGPQLPDSPAAVPASEAPPATRPPPEPRRSLLTISTADRNKPQM